MFHRKHLENNSNKARRNKGQQGIIKEILVKVVNGCKSLTLFAKKADHTEAVVHRYSSNMCS